MQIFVLTLNQLKKLDELAELVRLYGYDSPEVNDAYIDCDHDVKMAFDAKKLDLEEIQEEEVKALV